MYPDGVQYLDIARSVAAGEFSELLNTYWSPLYPLLIAGPLAVLKPPAYWWYPVLQGVNAVIFACAVWQFHALLSTVDRMRAEWFNDERPPLLPEPFWTWTAYALFLLLVTFLLNVRMMTPDMIVACAWLAAARYLLEAQRDPRRSSWWIKTGSALAVGYLAKAVVFPTTMIVGAAALVWGVRRGAWRGPVLVLATFLAVTTPYVVLLSQAWGGPTFGETGRVNYAWYVNEWPGGIYWRGEPPTSGVPVNPPCAGVRAPGRTRVSDDEDGHVSAVVRAAVLDARDAGARQALRPAAHRRAHRPRDWGMGTVSRSRRSCARRGRPRHEARMDGGGA
jgi:hypothetical protein